MRQIVFGVSFLGLFFWGTHSNAQHTKTVEPKRDTLRYCSGKIISIIETDEKGQYHGKTTRYFRNRKPSEIETYNHGFLQGKSIYFYETGDTSVSIEWQKGIQHGEIKAYYPNGNIMFKNQMFAGNMQSECAYFDTTGLPFNGFFNENSFRNGVGRVRKVNCINGKPDGDLIVYDEESCALIFKCPYKKGVLDGRLVEYDTKGKLTSARIYENGKYIKEDDSLYFENIQTYTNYLKFDSTNTSIYYLRALSQLRLLNKSKAVKDLDKVIQMDPKYYKAYYNRGVILADSIPAKALADFKKCNSLQPDFYVAHHNTGFIYFQQKEYKKAIEGFKKALLYKPDYLPSINTLGLVYEILKDKKKSDYYFGLANSIENGPANILDPLFTK